MPADLDLSELDALMTQATPGPWETRLAYGAAPGDDLAVARVDGDIIAFVGDPEYFENPRNARAIVALRNAWPALRERLAAAEADRAELERLRRVKLEAESLVAWDWLDMLKDCHDANDVRRDVQRLEAALHGEEST